MKTHHFIKFFNLGRNLTKPGQSITEPEEAKQLEWFSGATEKELFAKLKTNNLGLTKNEAGFRLLSNGFNEILDQKKSHNILHLLSHIFEPLNLVLLLISGVSYLTGDLRSSIIILVMVLLSVGLRFYQELKAQIATEKLKSLIHVSATVIRNKIPQEILVKYLVPGDIIKLNAGDMIPADIRILSSKDLYINQATLTGEAIPAEKHATCDNAEKSLIEKQNLCFLGTSVESGIAVGLVIFTGHRTYLGHMAKSISSQRPVSSFDLGVKKFAKLMLYFMAVMVPLVFLLNGFFKGTWFEAFLFAIAVAIGIAPEMLPMIVTVNLSKGAVVMSRKKVIIKHLDAIQNIGAMDVLCTDKTGTLTEGRVVLEKYLDPEGNDDLKVLNMAYLNSFYQTGMNDLLDKAILNHHEVNAELEVKTRFKKIDEIPFDFERRMMSVIVADENDGHMLICKGAVEEILKACKQTKRKTNIEVALNADGLRVLAIAYKKVDAAQKVFTKNNETNLTLVGFLAFLDPAKASAGLALKELEDLGIKVKILTGDNETVTRKICNDVGLTAEKILLGKDIDLMTDAELKKTVEEYSFFAKLSPENKERIIRTLKSNNHVVGFLGDGINDSPSLVTADVGISVDTAVDIAKESSDIILLEKSLTVLQDGVLEGRRIFGNVVKYIQMAASSNFGNMLSVVGGSIFLPFLPMLPIQIITNNILYDLSQTAIPTDRVDPEYLKKPRKWDLKNIRNFILFLGPVSSIFDYATWFLMILVFGTWANTISNQALFHTAWFVESLFSQTLIIHIIRTSKMPFINSRASWPLTITTVLVILFGSWLPYSPFAQSFGFTPLPFLYWIYLFIFMILYIVLAQIVKTWFARKFNWT